MTNERIEAGTECHELKRIVESHQARFGDDSLLAFLRIHHCICKNIAREQHSPAIKQINICFVQRISQVYSNFESGSCAPRDLSDNWVTALQAYVADAHSYYRVLPKLAKAHILDDLPECLYPLDITKQDYDNLFDTIINCLREVLRILSGQSAADRIFARLFDSSIGPYKVRDLRERAWNKVQDRKTLARNAD